MFKHNILCTLSKPIFPADKLKDIQHLIIAVAIDSRVKLSRPKSTHRLTRMGLTCQNTTKKTVKRNFLRLLLWRYVSLDKPLHRKIIQLQKRKNYVTTVVKWSTVRGFKGSLIRRRLNTIQRAPTTSSLLCVL